MATEVSATTCGHTLSTIDCGGGQSPANWCHQQYPCTTGAVGQRPPPMPVLLRGSIARSLYERMQREDQLRQFDKTKWYNTDSGQLSDGLIHTFVQMDFDCETKQFLDICYERSDQYFTHLFHSIARTILCLFMSSTSVNGLLGRGSMFVFSDDQFRRLLGQYLVPEELQSSYSSDMINEKTILDISSDKVLLDLGAGDGRVTEVMAQYFNKTFTTEMSTVMKKILIRKGFHVLDIEEWHESGLVYDVISCLNVLDRCDKPITMLAQIKGCLRPKTGLLLLALVLPFSQYVEVNDRRSDHRPTEVLAIEGQGFEEQLQTFTDNVLTPNGWQVMKWTKLPYLCEGDIDLTYYWLYDVVLVLKPTDL